MPTFNARFPKNIAVSMTEKVIGVIEVYPWFPGTDNEHWVAEYGKPAVFSSQVETGSDADFFTSLESLKQYLHETLGVEVLNQLSEEPKNGNDPLHSYFGIYVPAN